MFFCDCCDGRWASERYPFSMRDSPPESEGEQQARVILWKAEHDAAYERANMMKKRIFSTILTLCMLCSLMPFALAANDIITLDKDVYQPGAQMIISLSGTFPEGAHVMIYKDTAAHLIAAKDFTVAYNTTGKPGITLNKTIYALEEAMTITATGLSDVQIESGAVLMIYPQNAKLDQFKDYYNVRELDVSNTWKAAAPRETGIYEVRLYAQYPTYLTDLAAGLLAQTTFSVGGVTLPNQPVSGPGAAHPSTQ